MKWTKWTEQKPVPNKVFVFTNGVSCGCSEGEIRTEMDLEERELVQIVRWTGWLEDALVTDEESNIWWMDLPELPERKE